MVVSNTVSCYRLP
ncbi:hypothetical protein Zm00014a_040642 [Zea mays]|uniref:Uncharacterized protein n=1 Tax=Zea mays TaxID=4577 RepID=A0A3L6DR61_MAIZE|nr:hypothetical protein Zm00014a_040642 [Zea mays]